MENRSTFRYLPMFLSAFMGESIISHDRIPARYTDFYTGVVENPIYIPRRKKLKGFQKELKRKHHYNKFKNG